MLKQGVKDSLKFDSLLLNINDGLATHPGCALPSPKNGLDRLELMIDKLINAQQYCK